MQTLLPRRQVLGAAGLAAAATVPGRRQRHRRPVVVLVGGNSATPFFWDPLIRSLGLRGVPAIAVELPGHGLAAQIPRAYQSPQDLDAFAAEPSSLADATLADYVATTADTVRDAHRVGDVILVGHSLGGAVITRTADTVPDLLTQLVYVSAVCTSPEDPTPLDVVVGPANSTSAALTLPANEIGDPATSGVTRTNFRTSDPTYLEAYRDAVASELTEAEFLTLLNYAQQPVENATVSLEAAFGDPARWGRVPRTFVRLTADRFLTVPAQDAMIAAADARTPENRFTTVDLDASHLGVALRGDELADIVLHRRE